MSSHESAQKTPLRGHSKSPAVPQMDIDWSGYMDDEPNVHKAKKQSSQIAKELSDLVIYVQVGTGTYICVIIQLYTSLK